MKFRDLTAVDPMNREQMTRIVGGLTWGEAQSGRVLGATEYAPHPLGVPHTASVIWAQGQTGTSSYGELIQYRTDENGFPGTNAVKVRVGANLPPGLE